jgi:RNA polymerase sigma-70 factor (ECF subfamily)
LIKLLDQPNNEACLLLQVAKGDEKAFSSLYYKYHHRLGIYLYQLTSSKEFAEEIIQDVFCKVWDNKKQLPDIENFQLWLFIVSRNHARNCLRKMVQERKNKQLWEKQQLNLSGGCDITAEDRLQLIDKAISQLPSQQKRVFILSRYKRRKYIEIATELNLSKETVKSYLKIANSSIRKFVDTHLHLPLLLWWLFY